jgi:hypothetical protein
MCRKISLVVAVDATHSERDDSGRKLISPNLEEMLSQRKKKAASNYPTSTHGSS